MPIGKEAVTTPVEDKFVSDKGTVFEVKQRSNGLYFIHMAKGGKAPPMCEEFYTSRKLAEQTLALYLAQRDRLGYAKYPTKGN